MKKSKLLILSLIALLMVIGLVLISCDEKDKCSGKCVHDGTDEYVGKYCDRPISYEDAKCQDKCNAVGARNDKQPGVFRCNCN